MMTAPGLRLPRPRPRHAHDRNRDTPQARSQSRYDYNNGTTTTTTPHHHDENTSTTTTIPGRVSPGEAACSIRRRLGNATTTTTTTLSIRLRHDNNTDDGTTPLSQAMHVREVWEVIVHYGLRPALFSTGMRLRHEQNSPVMTGRDWRLELSAYSGQPFSYRAASCCLPDPNFNRGQKPRPADTRGDRESTRLPRPLEATPSRSKMDKRVWRDLLNESFAHPKKSTSTQLMRSQATAPSSPRSFPHKFGPVYNLEKQKENYLEVAVAGLLLTCAEYPAVLVFTASKGTPWEQNTRDDM
ncbi:hypothetical protein BDZ89DRAFT_1038791 [Hymenopellis radicata]|nr:hypothetical protein BDZ89DRAFT_1038791 [Hymenopellis radicata]